MSNSSRTITVALAGVGGYGATYLGYLDQIAAARNLRLVAGIDPAGEKAPRWNELKQNGVALYPSLDDFYAARADRPDLIVLALPIHLHACESIRALEHGLNAVVEKPLCSTLDEAGRMIAARDKAGKVLAIGYQGSYTDAVQNLKADILAGKLGRPLRMKCLVLWPRKRSYYQRSGWAGAKQTRSGAWVFDSPANNATSHYLHQMCYLLGDRVTASAHPVETLAELYRANPITNFDTGAARLRMNNGTEVLFYCAHAVESQLGPRYSYEFEHATINFERNSDLIARFRDGREKNYGSPEADQSRKLYQTADAIRGGPPIPCSVEAALGQTRAIDAMQRSVPDIAEFPAEIRRQRTDPDGDTLTYAEGLVEILTNCYEQNKLPHELNVPWAKKGKIVT